MQVNLKKAVIGNHINPLGNKTIVKTEGRFLDLRPIATKCW